MDLIDTARGVAISLTLFEALSRYGTTRVGARASMYYASVAHSLCLVYGALAVPWYPPMLQRLILLSLTYFGWDTVQGIEGRWLTPDYAFHHAVGIVINSYGFAYWDRFVHVAPYLLLSEVSTLFLNIYKIERAKGRDRKWLGYMFAVCFAVFRVMLMPLAIVESDDPWMRVAFSLLYLLQLYWFVLIVRKVMREFNELEEST